MAKDPAFLFYPGDVLKHINLMTPIQRGLYLTILVNHMEHISFSYETLMLIISNSQESDKNTIMKFLTEIEPGQFCIEWARESILKRRAYSESRAKNRTGTTEDMSTHMKEDMLNTSSSYVKHMVNENEIEDITDIVDASREKFEIFRRLYPGTKRGLDSEYQNFKKKHKDYKSVIDLLVPAVENWMLWASETKSANGFVPEYPMLATWINKRRWETEYQVTKSEDPSAKYEILKSKGWKNCTKEELEWAYDHQHRTMYSYLEYQEIELLGQRGGHKTKAEYKIEESLNR